jgi:hypothetical protein
VHARVADTSADLCGVGRFIRAQNQVICAATQPDSGSKPYAKYSAIGACLLGGTCVRHVISLDPRTGAQPRGRGKAWCVWRVYR